MPSIRNLAVAAIAALIGASGCTSTPDGPASEAGLNPADWDAVLAAADGTTLNLHMWGGSAEINGFVDTFYAPRLDELGIRLRRIPLADTADAVNAVLGELEAGRVTDGSIDLIWINGENFATMRQAEALREGWSEQLPNATFVDWADPSVAFDAGLPVDGAESPWGSAQFQLVYDQARMDTTELPRSFADLATWIEQHPGRFTYPGPPAFHGTRFLKQWHYELSGGHEPWIGTFSDDDYERSAAQLWDVLDELRPSLWRQGETYPNDIAELDRLFANGEVDFTFTQLPAGIQAGIVAGTLPATAKPFVLDTGTIGDHHYLGIPVNAPNPAAAMVFANLVLEPALQAAKLDPINGWGDGLAISLDLLDGDDIQRILAVEGSLDDTAVPQEALERVRRPDSSARHTAAIERDWNAYIRQRRPRP